MNSFGLASLLVGSMMMATESEKGKVAQGSMCFAKKTPAFF